MSLVEQVQNEMKEAMKAKEALRLGVLRMIQTALKNKQVELRKPLEDTDELAILRSLVNQGKIPSNNSAKAAAKNWLRRKKRN